MSVSVPVQYYRNSRTDARATVTRTKSRYQVWVKRRRVWSGRSRRRAHAVALQAIVEVGGSHVGFS